MNEYSYEKLVKDPAVFADNRLPARSDHLPFRSAEEMAIGESSLRLCLDGVWKFHYAKSVQTAPDGFWKADYDTAGWDTIRAAAR